MSHLPKQWYTWPTGAAFDTWHQTVINGLELPQIGYNAKTGDPAPEAAWTTAYTTVTEVDVDDWRAPVEQYVADVYTTGLGAPSEPPPPPQPYPSWTLDDQWNWQPPTPYPDDGNPYVWNEDTHQWQSEPPPSTTSNLL